ncbi:hypothetical protein VTJ83DRAFT_3277 [Remersonia thermophila]|uniref:Uncharacterized protein n=1 Tax=Remersonia thermophila TaxID=72144 RepID=A0ABR4DF05_9PEZI
MSWSNLAGAPLGHAPTVLLRRVAAPWASQTAFASLRGHTPGIAQSSNALAFAVGGRTRRPFGTSGSQSSRQPPRFQTPGAPPTSAPPPSKAPGSNASRSPPATSKAKPAPPSPAASSASQPSPARRPLYPMPPPPGKKPVDVNSKEYKQLASRWVRIIVGLPFVIVTSWLLYKRLVNPPDEEQIKELAEKQLTAFPQRPGS